MRPTDRHLLFSVGKVYVSTLVGILEDRGIICADSPIDSYIPELKDSGWEGVRIIDILDMASGVDAPEEIDGAYTDPSVKHYQFEASLGWLPKVASLPESAKKELTHELLASLMREDEPGMQQDYASVNTAGVAC